MRRRRDSGASLVEFALILPLLCLLLFGIIQFGIAYDRKQSVNSAAREAARAAAIPSNDFSEIDSAARTAFRGLADDSGDRGFTVTVNAPGYTGSREVPASGPPTQTGDTGAPCDGQPEGSNVVVQVDVEHRLTIPFFGVRDTTLTGRGEFRCERAIT